MLRILLFVGTNLAVLFVLNLILTLFGLNQPGMSSSSLLIMAGIVGMAGSFISLLMSKAMAKRATGASVIEQPSNEMEAWLVATVKRQAEAAGIGTPEVAVFQSSTPNAFATGAKKDASLVAVSTGLLANMSRDEVEAVLGHEVSHVANGDMVTLALVQGVLNTFVIVLSHVVSAMVDRRGTGGYGNSGYGYGLGLGYRVSYMVTQTVFGFLATLIVRWFSRFREYRADRGGAQLASRESMIAALERLRALQRPAQLPAEMQSFGITPAYLGVAGLKRLMMTHPPLDECISALRATAGTATTTA